MNLLLLLSWLNCAAPWHSKMGRNSKTVFGLSIPFFRKAILAFSWHRLCWCARWWITSQDLEKIYKTMETMPVFKEECFLSFQPLLKFFKKIPNSTTHSPENFWSPCFPLMHSFFSILPSRNKFWPSLLFCTKIYLGSPNLLLSMVFKKPLNRQCSKTIAWLKKYLHWRLWTRRFLIWSAKELISLKRNLRNTRFWRQLQISFQKAKWSFSWWKWKWQCCLWVQKTMLKFKPLNDLSFVDIPYFNFCIFDFLKTICWSEIYLMYGKYGKIHIGKIILPF